MNHIVGLNECTILVVGVGGGGGEGMLAPIHVHGSTMRNPKGIWGREAKFSEQMSKREEGHLLCTACAHLGGGDAMSRLQTLGVNQGISNKFGFCSDVLLFKKEASHLRRGSNRDDGSNWLFLMVHQSVSVPDGPSAVWEERLTGS